MLHDVVGVSVDDLTDAQMRRLTLRNVLALRDELAGLRTEMEFRMANLEEVTVALGAAVDRIGVVLADVTASKDAAVAAAAQAQLALDTAIAADLTEDADFQAQIDALTAALQAANDALNAQVAAADAAVASITSDVAELNALGAPAEEEPPVVEGPPA
jgi:hypothetical protein